ncbi:class I SAM-dependent methyltransferase [Planctomicrobium piriforme]|uniref:Capsular polysaccharide synthesis protein n=1 Tax=Planctomicrobium piriforme TaxID=1576369 RepID=A0A1I3P2K8_9PLAN|nr:class I SAM-dependent methyltransferase [Planctomicrobium piriforme]SFJ15774.1 Capsular polysaccharide synthesis protein [Planctomicrobium piriforme]
MKIDWNSIYSKRGLFSGYGSRGQSAQIKRQALEKLIEKYQPRSILDVGCGDKYVIDQVDLKGADYLGIDASSVLINSLTASKLNQIHRCEEFLQFDTSRQFDLVICLDVLGHLDDPVEYRRFTERLLQVARDVILVSGYASDTEAIRRSSTEYFHEPLIDSFVRGRTKVLGTYRGVQLAEVALKGVRSRQVKIWTYWETPLNGKRPEYLDLCEETWHRHCGDDFEIVRVTPETAPEFVPNLIEEWHRLPCLAHKADYLRAALVHRHGGIWLDNDMIVLRNLNVMMSQLESSGSDFIGCGRPGKRPSNGVFGGAAGSRLLADYIESMNRLLKSRTADLKLRWTELGYNLLWPLTRNYEFHQYDFRVCIPVPPSRFRRFFDRKRLVEMDASDCDLRDDTLTVYLYNAMFPGWFKQLSLDCVARSPLVIGQFFRHALQVPNWQELIDSGDWRRELRQIRNRNGIARFLSDAGLNDRIAEIGVRTGNHLEHLVANSKASHFIGVDAWTSAGPSSQNDVGASQLQLDELERSVRERFAKYGSRGQIVKGFSHEVAANYPDESFDFIYIDADHSYAAVRRDLEAWFPKVRKGGILAGHDYVQHTSNRVTFGVISAVDEFVSKHGLDPPVVTPDRWASWILFKPVQDAGQRFCYVSAGFGAPRHVAMLRGLVKSARGVGVTDDFHVWTDSLELIEGAHTHRYSKEEHAAPRYMFKMEILKAAQENGYDYSVFLDADSFFVRRPSRQNIIDMLNLANPLHLSLEGRIDHPRYTKAQMHARRWWGMSLGEIQAAFHAKGLGGKPLYAGNGGFIVVKNSEFKRVYEIVWNAFRYLYDELGNRHVADEVALAYAMAACTNPDGHLLKNTRINSIWCPDRGVFRGRLPTGEPFPFHTNWDGQRFTVNPAIVHAMKSKLELIDYGSQCQEMDRSTCREDATVPA